MTKNLIESSTPYDLEEWQRYYPNIKFKEVIDFFSNISSNTKLTVFSPRYGSEKTIFTVNFHCDIPPSFGVSLEYALSKNAKTIHIENLHSSDIVMFIDALHKNDESIGDETVFPPSNPLRTQFIASLLGKLSELGGQLDIEFVTAECGDLGSVYWSKILIPTSETWQNVKQEAKNDFLQSKTLLKLLKK